jgi:hypothetical protein
MSQVLHQYLALLGLRPGASLQRITSQYFFLLEKFPEHLSQDQLAAKQKMQHAYEVLKTAYSSRAPGRVRRKRRKVQRESSRAITVGLGTALVLLFGVFLVLNSTNLKIKLMNHEVGDVLRLKDSNEPYGKVIRFDSSHSFSTGLPGPAYEIQLTGSSETVWVNERIVEDRMVKSGSD